MITFILESCLIYVKPMGTLFTIYLFALHDVLCVIVCVFFPTRLAVIKELNVYSIGSTFLVNNVYEISKVQLLIAIEISEVLIATLANIDNTYLYRVYRI
uniref:Uncharacterized protein n=1 Tax=Cacopsylla melanoneura TaxID=428564 RepID=A0A8D9BUV0_9HEMI